MPEFLQSSWSKENITFCGQSQLNRAKRRCIYSFFKAIILISKNQAMYNVFQCWAFSKAFRIAQKWVREIL